MRIEGFLADKELQALDVTQPSWSLPRRPRLWAMLAEPDRIEIWCRRRHDFDKVATLVRESEGDFIQNISQWLLAARDQDALDRIILIAPDDLMQSFHELMPTDTAALVAAEISRDLSGFPDSERSRILNLMIPV